MNKQEKSKMHRFINDNEFITMYIGGGAEFETTVVDSKRLRRLISKMDDQPEPQKVKVPKCVGELLDYYRNSTDVDLLALLICFKNWYFRKDKTSEYEEAINWLVTHPEQFMKAWLDGYEVEDEPLYTVTINLDRKYHLVLDEGDGDDEISTTLTTSHGVLGYRYFLTEKEIKSIDERYWAFAVPVKAFVEDYEVEEEPKWAVKEGDLVIRKGCHEAKVYFVESVDDDGILLVNGIKDEFFTDLDDRSVGEESVSYFYKNFRLLAKKDNLEVEKVEV